MQTKDASGIQTVKIDTSILNKGECTCLVRFICKNLKHVNWINTCMLLSNHMLLVMNIVMHKISVINTGL